MHLIVPLFENYAFYTKDRFTLHIYKQSGKLQFEQNHMHIYAVINIATVSLIYTSFVEAPSVIFGCFSRSNRSSAHANGQTLHNNNQMCAFRNWQSTAIMVLTTLVTLMAIPFTLFHIVFFFSLFQFNFFCACSISRGNTCAFIWKIFLIA